MRFHSQSAEIEAVAPGDIQGLPITHGVYRAGRDRSLVGRGVALGDTFLTLAGAGLASAPASRGPTGALIPVVPQPASSVTSARTSNAARVQARSSLVFGESPAVPCLDRALHQRHKTHGGHYPSDTRARRRINANAVVLRCQQE